MGKNPEINIINYGLTPIGFSPDSSVPARVNLAADIQTGEVKSDLVYKILTFPKYDVFNPPSGQIIVNGTTEVSLLQTNLEADATHDYRVLVSPRLDNNTEKGLLRIANSDPENGENIIQSLVGGTQGFYSPSAGLHFILAGMEPLQILPSDTIHVNPAFSENYDSVWNGTYEYRRNFIEPPFTFECTGARIDMTAWDESYVLVSGIQIASVDTERLDELYREKIAEGNYHQSSVRDIINTYLSLVRIA